MRYRAKIAVITQGKMFEPGSILPKDISKSDLAFLKTKKFVEPVDIPAAANEETEDDSDQEFGEFSDFFDEAEPPGLKSPDAVWKIRSKKEVAAYAESIGLSLGENYEEKNLKDLQAAVIDFQEEQMESMTEGE